MTDPDPIDTVREKLEGASVTTEQLKAALGESERRNAELQAEVDEWKREAHYSKWPQEDALEYQRLKGDQVVLDARISELERQLETTKLDQKSLEDAQDRARDAEHLLRRIDGWDHMDTAADGPYWRGEIRALLEKT